jgi:hypothetical protein
MYSCSYGISSVVLSMCFGRVIVLWICPYSCLLFNTLRTGDANLRHLRF